MNDEKGKGSPKSSKSLERLIDPASYGHVRRYRGAGGIDQRATNVQNMRSLAAANDTRSVH